MGNNYDVLIAGGGPAGITAAIYAVRAGLKVAVIEKLFVGGQIATTHLMENYPGFESGVSGAEFAMKLNEQAINLGVEIIYDDIVSSELMKDMKTLCSANNEYFSRTVIIATGAQARTLGLADEDRLRGLGVSYCATCDGGLYRGGTLAVVGGGNTALEESLYLTGIAGKVYMIHRREELRGMVGLKDLLLSKPNAEIIWNSVIDGLEGGTELQALELRNVLTGEKSSLKVDALFVAIGRIPDSAPFKGAVDMDENGYILADEAMATNVKGVFVAGDVRVKVLRQVATAVGDGAIAAQSAAAFLL